MDDATMDAGSAIDAPAEASPDAVLETDASDAVATDVPADVAADVLTCTPPQTACAGRCVDTASDDRNCGSCGRACSFANGTGACTTGACTITACNLGYLDCDHDASNGCEAPALRATDCGMAHTPVQISAGLNFSCAVLSDGTVRCWGENDIGQVGDGTMGTNRNVPTRVVGLAGVVEVSAGWQHSCARLIDGTIRCWGQNNFGQCGDLTTMHRSTPVAVSGLTGVIRVASGYRHTCALMADHTVQCWGGNTSGELGDNGTTDRLAPGPVPGLTGVASISGKGLFMCALMMDGTGRCWGQNIYGQVGDGTSGTDRPSPRVVVGLSDAVAITGAHHHSCAVLMNGTAACWGRAASLGTGSTIDRSMPMALTGLSNVRQIDGLAHSCARLSNGTAMCWDTVWSGDGTSSIITRPTSPVAGLTTIEELAVGYRHACARLTDGALWCWGQNATGEVGDGTMMGRTAPVRVSGL